MTKSPDVPAPYPTYTSSDSHQVYPLPIISILRISNLEPSPPGVRISTLHARCTPPLAVQIHGSLRTRTVAHPRYLEKQAILPKTSAACCLLQAQQSNNPKKDDRPHDNRDQQVANESHTTIRATRTTSERPILQERTSKMRKGD